MGEPRGLSEAEFPVIFGTVFAVAVVMAFAVAPPLIRLQVRRRGRSAPPATDVTWTPVGRRTRPPGGPGRSGRPGPALEGRRPRPYRNPDGPAGRGLDRWLVGLVAGDQPTGAAIGFTAVRDPDLRAALLNAASTESTD